MSTPSSFDDKERADLVAYLDGELDGDAARRIEQKLALDDAARAEATALKKTWDLLDFLPRTEPSPSFTHRTMERLTPIRTGAQRSPGRRWPWRTVLLGAAWAAALLLSVLGGYAGFNQLTSHEPGDAELVKDLHVIENLRTYELVEDIDFVRQLDQPDLFGEDRSEL